MLGWPWMNLIPHFMTDICQYPKLAYTPLLFIAPGCSQSPGEGQVCTQQESNDSL